MTKTFNTEDIVVISPTLTVIIDRQVDYSASDLLFNGNKIGTIHQMPNSIGVYKIVATIGDKLDNLPTIDIDAPVDEVDKRYSEKQMLEIYQLGRTDAIESSIAKRMINNSAVHLNQIKQIVGLELDYEYLSNTGEWKSVLLPSEWEADTKKRLKIHNEENNSVTPTKITYSGAIGLINTEHEARKLGMKGF